MKKKQYLTYIVAGTLLASGTFLGTRALFSDTKTSTNSLTLRTGKVAIQINEDDWLRNVNDTNNDGHITPLDKPYQQGVEQNSQGIFENVHPGDTFSRYINVLNGESSYAVTISIQKEFTGDKQELMQFIEVDDSNLQYLTTLPKHSNSGGYITIKIKDTPEAWKAFNGAGEINLNDTYTITATQAE